MNTKLIIATAALAVSMGTASTFANASPLGLCATGTTCYNAQPGYKALGKVKPAPKALGRVVVPAVVLPPLVIGQPAPAPLPTPPASQPSGSPIVVGVDPGDFENNNYDGISCGEGRSIVRHSGFRKVHAIDCSSDVFTYAAKKHDQRFKVFVNSDGYIVHVSNLSY